MIELKNVHKTYQMGKVQVKALQGVSLRIQDGEFVAIMGPSGSGKSTLMHVMGLLDRPDAGEYYLGGTKVNALSDGVLSAIRNRLVGFVFQQFHLLPRLTALENAMLPLIYAGKRHMEDKVLQRLDEVGLAARARHRPNELSGGEQQRVAIARSLVNDPPIILADEPTGNLDSKSKAEIIAIFRQLNRGGKTVVIVTHEQEVALNAGRIIRVLDGRIVSDEQVAASVQPVSEGIASKVQGAFAEAQEVAAGAKFIDYLRQASAAMLSHRMRSLLSILGILIGVAAVIAMLALGEGAKTSIEQQLASLGSNVIVVRPGSPRISGIALETGTVTRFTFQDIAAIEKLEEVKRVSPSVMGRAQIVYADKNWNTQVEGVGEEYAAIRSSYPAIGRFFSGEEVRAREKVALLGTTVAKALFQDSDPVGETIKINLVNFKVIGVLQPKGAAGFRDQDDTVLIPVTTAMYRVFGKEYIDTIYVEANGPGLIDAAQEAIASLIIKQHRLGKNEEDSFQIRNLSEIRNALLSTTTTMSLLLGAIAAISLLVGGIGIMNIMLVSVSERTREIGLRKAIGATYRDIMVQFLIEAILLSFIGGISGILLGAAASVLITLFAGWAVKISPASIMLATLFSLMVGIIFGLWPARKAAQLDPIEALRYE